jgi:hypothetical protein
MAFRDLFRAVRRAPNSFPDAPPQGENVEEESIEVLAVRGCIAKVFEARLAHVPVMKQKKFCLRELNQVTGDRANVQTRLAAREKEIALTGGELPDEPFPEDAELTRLNRHVRILQERVRVCEAKERESEAQIAARISEMEQSWCVLGAATSQGLLDGFREAAHALKEVQLRYISLGRYFFHSWNSAVWKSFDKNFAISDPGSRSLELILDPLRAQLPAKWPASVTRFLKSMEDLRAEVDAVKSGEASVSPVAMLEED